MKCRFGCICPAARELEIQFWVIYTDKSNAPSALAIWPLQDFDFFVSNPRFEADTQLEANVERRRNDGREDAQTLVRNTAESSMRREGNDAGNGDRV